MPDSPFLRALADSLLAAEPNVDQIVARLGQTLGTSRPWQRALAKRYLRAFAGKTRPRRVSVIQFLRQDRVLQHAAWKYPAEMRIWNLLMGPQQMQPVAAAAAWNVPRIESPDALADWLRLTPGELRWFADLNHLNDRSRIQKLSHYHYQISTKPAGGWRLIESPKPRLKHIQQQVLHHILERIPPHRAVHGFLKGRSIQTFAAPHVGRRVVLRMDLQDFFPTFRGARIRAFFRTLGYPETVADLLGGLCTNAVSHNAWPTRMHHEDSAHRSRVQAFYSRVHLPQGAPTSPLLANLCAYRMDCRLAGLAESAGARYTRYADDLAFSGEKDFERGIERFSTHVAAILLEEGFQVHFRKTRVMRQGVRQHLTGIVVNRRLNVMRPDFDRLKAILTNCVRLGPESQNREGHANFRSHLEGRIGFMEMIHPQKGARLRRIYREIRWP
jgi:hypothetical protein